MRKQGGILEPLLAVFSQFWAAGRAYSLLRDGRNAGMIMIAAVVVIFAAGYIPAMLVDWQELELQWRDERIPELTGEGFSAAGADSVVTGELGEMREMTENLPMARLVERGIIALLGALTAFGTVYAVEGKKVGRLIDFITSCVLSQSAYMITGVFLILLVSLMKIPPSIRLNLSAFVPIGTADPSRIHVFLFRFLESIDVPSLVCLVLWGLGLSSILHRTASWGMRLVFSVYVIGIMLISLPVMFAPAA